MIKRILFIAEGISLAHIGRTLALAEGLPPLTYEIHFACDRRYQHLVPTQFTFHHVHTNAVHILDDRLAKGAPLFTTDEVCSYIQEDKALLSKVQPKIVISDFRLSMAISCKEKNIPIWSLCNAHWSPEVKQTFPLPELQFFKKIGWKLSSFFYKHTRSYFIKKALKEHAQSFVKAGFPDRSAHMDIRHIYSYGDKTLFLDPPQFIPLKNLFPNQKFIGPVLWEPKCKEFSIEAILKTKSPRIYVTLGTSGSTAVVDILIKGLANWPGTIIWATAGRFKRTLPSHFLLHDFLPAQSVMPHCDLVICNGGSGTAYQAFANGLPVLGITTNVDQAWTIQHAVNKNAALNVRSWNLNLENFEKMIRQLQTPEMRSAAHNLQKDFSQSNAISDFTHLIAEFFSPPS